MDTCRVCGDGNAKTHYGVVTCFGCKGFFRRTLKRPSEYQCRHNGTCVVDRHERNSCRYCRFKRCIEVGMDPKAVRPDRDATGRHYQGRQRRSKLSNDDEGEIDAEWIRKLPVEMRTTLMQISNIDLMVGGGDVNIDGTMLYPLNFTSIRHVLEDPSVLDGKRTEMRYDSFREVEPSELQAIAHRNLISAIDWVDHLFDIMDIQNLDDKIVTVKHCFAPLMVFCFSVITAKNTNKHDIVTLCNYGYVRRDCDVRWNEPYHFGNRLAERALDELISPFRRMNIKEEEAALMKAIIIANPYIKGLSVEASETIADMRDRIQETLYHVVRETHPKEVASSRFGNLLLFIPSVML
ncbi:zinc finger, C4 type [Oesophagostomum dentatum]|uniref:Zinc finger, C4 type n=1 Tax=Oesophagostomum dentatum TaxID=61180 RepID=A0A0B1TMN5_OESDE|nr:zinc finger, C4 type [Oesophagostomum dentatum]